MWYKVKSSREVEIDEKQKNLTEIWITDVSNFAEAGFKVAEMFNGDVDIEEVKLMKNIKEIANKEGEVFDKVYIAKIIQDFTNEDGSKKELKYDILLYANDSNQATNIINEYMQQGFDNMRVKTLSETKLCII